MGWFRLHAEKGYGESESVSKTDYDELVEEATSHWAT